MSILKKFFRSADREPQPDSTTAPGQEAENNDNTLFMTTTENLGGYVEVAGDDNPVVTRFGIAVRTGGGRWGVKREFENIKLYLYNGNSLRELEQTFVHLQGGFSSLWDETNNCLYVFNELADGKMEVATFHEASVRKYSIEVIYSVPWL